MADIGNRFKKNPLITPSDIKPSQAGWEVVCVLNPGAFTYKGKVGLLMRVAERPIQEEGFIATATMTPEGVSEINIPLDHPELSACDPRGFSFKGKQFVTTLSHLRLAWSENHTDFVVEDSPFMVSQTPLEAYGIEDARVEFLDDSYCITYTAASDMGVGVGLATTQDWKNIEHKGVIIPPDNKDCALFKVDDLYYSMHRPIAGSFNGLNIWLATSPDLIHWGNHQCLAKTRPGMWDSERIGAGAAPILTDAGYLEIYHGCDDNGRYCLGALLLDKKTPSKVLARSSEPIMEPLMPYEQKGFYGNCIFTNGSIIRDDAITMYYGASDSVVCGATVAIEDVLGSLK